LQTIKTSAKKRRVRRIARRAARSAVAAQFRWPATS
jgi:hypothetical protein